jgi:NAD(P)H-dependent FMN reductase
MPHDLLKNNFYNHRHPEILKVVDEIKSVDALLFVLPEYHGSYPGIAKLFLDLMPSATFKNKKVALVGISDGHVGNLRGIDHFTGVMNYLRAHVIPLAPKISYVNRMINDSSFVPDERAKNLFTELFTELTG